MIEQPLLSLRVRPLHVSVDLVVGAGPGDKNEQVIIAVVLSNDEIVMMPGPCSDLKVVVDIGVLESVDATGPINVQGLGDDELSARALDVFAPT